jgi:hypothetical protein
MTASDFAATVPLALEPANPALPAAPARLPADSGVSAPQAAETGAPGDLQRGRLMQRSLHALLNRVAGARAALPHLAALELALGEQGACAVHSISQRGLAKIHTQLRVLPLEPSDGPIQDLLALVQRALRQQARQQRTHQLSPHDPQSTVIISETSESDFMDALAEARGSSARPLRGPAPSDQR